MVKLPIYMDNHATTPLEPRVLDAMMPYLRDRFGNAASRNHKFGWEAEEAVEQARKEIAALIGADAREIVITSGATESDNLAVKGVAWMYREKGDHIITAVTEHKAILDTCKHLEKDGFRITFLPVDNQGLVDLDDIRRAITDKTILISIMTANNEVGVVQDIKQIGKIARERGVLFDTDAVQAAGRIPFSGNEMDINGDLQKRLPGNLNMSFAYVEGESLLMGINDIAVSSGSACTSASLEPSYVLKALGVGEDLAHTSIRFGIGRFNTEEEVDYVANRVIEVVRRLRELSQLYEMAKEGIDLKSVHWATEGN